MRPRGLRAAAGLVMALAVLAGCSSSQAESVQSVDLVSDVADPLVIAHRGGPLVYPEHSMEGYQAAADAGFAAEPDIQFLSDGTPVALHDDTVDRTMTGVTGAVSGLTLDEWETARIRPAVDDGPTAAPVTFAEILNELGGGALLVPEVKPDATPAQVDAVVDMVTERDLDRAVLMQSFIYSSVLQMLGAGLECMYLVGADLPPEPLEQVKSDGVEWIGAARDMAHGDVRRLTDAGFRVVAYTIKTNEELDELPAAFSGYFSNDPWAHAPAL